MRVDVAIVGGGLAGLACAVALAGSGLRIAVIEREPIAGGRARSWVDEATGDVVDIGPHVLLTEYRNLLGLLRHLGTDDRVVWQTDKLLALADAGRIRTIGLSPLPAPLHMMPSIVRMPPLSWADLASNLRISWLAMRIDERALLPFDAIDARTLLERFGVSRRMIDWFWRSACMTLLNVPLERCSAAALLRFYRHLIGHSRFRFGVAGVGLGELFVPQAIARIERAGGRVLHGTEVAGFVDDGGRAGGVALADGSRIDARWCVAAVPPDVLRQLLPRRWLEREPALRELGAFVPSPYVSSYLWFDRPIGGERFFGSIWSPQRLNYDFYDLSRLRPGWRGRPSVIAANIIHSHRADSLSDEAIVAATVAELAEVAPKAATARVLHSRVHRIPMAIPCPLPGCETRRPPTETAIGGLLLAGDWTRTGMPASMESATCSGFAAAERLWAATGRARRLALPVRPTDGLAGLIRRTAGAGRRERV